MRIINLALQGGGSHGAFTWGVLDALLEDGRIGVEGLSGTSAGALNAVALASGWASAEAAGRDPREGAREALTACWTRVSGWGSLGALQQQFLKLLWGGLPQLSPYQANPLGINPLRDLLEAAIDFDAIAAHRELKVFVSATHVTTGKAVVFTGRKLDAAAVLASACLPTLFQAVEIDGEPYWDGGYSVNPALSPLTTECRTADMMLVQINPVAGARTPRTTAEIQDRVSEITFNASLLTQMRAIDFINRLVAEGAVSHPGCKAVRVHRIDGGPAMEDFPAATRGSPDAAMIAKLFRTGREAASNWLKHHYAAIGQRGTVDIRRDYLDDTRLELPTSALSPVRRLNASRFKPWLAALLRRRASR
jgi:NTE family protein